MRPRAPPGGAGGAASSSGAAPSRASGAAQQQGAALINECFSLYQKYTRLFEWCDGPLVAAMRDGDLFLLDEVSLAEDSVLERLNSVLARFSR